MKLLILSIATFFGIYSCHSMKRQAVDRIQPFSCLESSDKTDSYGRLIRAIERKYRYEKIYVEYTVRALDSVYYIASDCDQKIGNQSVVSGTIYYVKEVNGIGEYRFQIQGIRSTSGSIFVENGFIINSISGLETIE